MISKREKARILWNRTKELVSNRVERQDLMPGDHIYSWRMYVYAHHGIYIGDELVIHFTNAGGEIGTGAIFSSSSRRRNTGSCRNSECQASSSGVMASCLDCFLSGGKLYRFEYSASKARFQIKLRGLCTMVPSDPPEDVVNRALCLLEKGFGTYNLFKRNCEDFAIYCKTSLLADPGKVFLGQSSHVHSTLAAATSLVQPLVVHGVGFTSVIEGLCIYSGARCEADIGSRAKKVSLEELEGMNADLA